MKTRELKIRECYTRTATESVEEGDFSYSGISGEVICENALDAVDQLTVDGATSFSGSSYYSQGWYETEYYTVDYSTGEEEQRTYHLIGDWTETEKKWIYAKMTKLWKR